MTRYIPTLFLLLGIAFLAAGCDDAADKYYLKLPVEARLLHKEVACSDGSAGYVAFVADNTVYGGKIKLLDGCNGVIDENFSDGTKGDGAGLLAGPVVAGFDLMLFDDGLQVAIAVPEERQLVFKRLDTALAEVDLEKGSIALDMMPRTVDTLGNFFLVRGDDFMTERTALVAADGTVYPQTTGRRFSDIACDGERCVALEEGSGLPFLLTVTGPAAAPVLIADDADLPDGLTDAAPFTGIAALTDDRFVLWNDTAATVVTGLALGDAAVTTIPVPLDVRITTAAAAGYIGTRVYSILDDEQYFAKGTVYLLTSDGDNLFSSDSDEVIEDSLQDDGDAVLRLALTAADEAATDADTLVLPAGTYDAKGSDAIVWFATDSGRIFSYDMLTRGWMLEPLEEGVSGLPELTYAGATIPEEGDTTESNMPRIERVAAMRGLPFAISYELTYEALFEGSLSDGGIWNAADGLLIDDRADFTKFITGDPADYAILLTGTRQTEECLIPARTGISLPVHRVINGQALQLDPGLWGDDIAACYGDHISYGIYPLGRYLVRAVMPGGTVVERTAREMPAGWNAAVSREVSFSDRYVDVLVQRRTDKVTTARGLSFAFTVVPSRTFVGPDSTDIFERMLPLPNGHVLLFSPLKARIFEYSPVFEETVVTYR